MVREVEVTGDVHRDDTGHLPRLVDFEHLDAHVRDRRPHERDVQQPVDLEIVEVLRRTDEDPGVLPPDHRVPENRSRLRHGPSCRECGRTLTSPHHREVA